MPETKDIEKDMRYYVLHYSTGTKIAWKLFPFKGGLQDAIIEGRRHCEVMHYRYCMTCPGIVDLRHQERLKYADAEWNELMDEGRVKLMEKLDSKG